MINNAGHLIKNLRVSLIIFDAKEIPVVNASVAPDKEELPQGGIASFVFTLDNYHQEIANYYLYTNWKYDDSNW